MCIVATGHWDDGALDEVYGRIFIAFPKIERASRENREPDQVDDVADGDVDGVRVRVQQKQILISKSK